MSKHVLTVIVLVALIGWSLYRRARRTLQAQPLRRRRLIVRSILFILVAALIVAVTFAYPVDLLWEVAGVAVGLILAGFAIAGTRFERRPDGWYYKQSVGIGVVVLLLFVGRLVWRIAFAAQAVANGTGMPGAGGGSTPAGRAGAHAAANPYASDPWTSGLLLVLVAYYACYFLWLVWKEKQVNKSEVGQANG
jgi:membrane protein CcdC involved in cytochrome C biogenesis